MKLYLTTIFLLITTVLFAQQNLVLNPSLEAISLCPSSGGEINYAQDWRSGFGSVDFYHICGSNGFVVPLNYGGYEPAHTGVAYTGLAIFHMIPHNFREFPEVELIDSLIANRNYYVEFYISLADSLQYAIWSIGAFISINGIQGNTISQILSYTPQVSNTQGNYITNKLGWTKISGSFIAVGGEKYITIGNFEDDLIIDTLFVGGSSNSGTYDWRGSYYYLDDVAVYEDTIVGINDYNNGSFYFNIYPNPTTNELKLDFALTDKAIFELYDVLGTIRKTKTLDGNSKTESIDLVDLDSGLYFYSITDRRGGRIQTGKLVVIK
jgi:hypothetical protein